MPRNTRNQRPSKARRNRPGPAKPAKMSNGGFSKPAKRRRGPKKGAARHAPKYISVLGVPRFSRAATQSDSVVQTFAMCQQIIATAATPNPHGVMKILPGLFSSRAGFPFYQAVELMSISVRWLSTFGMARPGAVATLFVPDSEPTGTSGPMTYDNIIIEPNRSKSNDTLYNTHPVLTWRADPAYRMPYDRFVEGTGGERNHWAATVDPVLFWATDCNVPNSDPETMGRLEVRVTVRFSNLVYPAPAPTSDGSCPFEVLPPPTPAAQVCSSAPPARLVNPAPSLSDEKRRF